MNKIYHVFIPLMIGLLIISCEKQKDSVPIEEEDDKNSEIILDNGNIGLVIDTRPIAKKGYVPHNAIVTFDGSYSRFSQNLDIDTYTSVATLTIDLDSISDDQKEDFLEGVSTTIVIQSKNSTELASVSDKIKVDHSNKPLLIQTNLPKKYPNLNISEGQPYLIQAITDDPNVSNKLFGIRLDNGYEPGLDAITWQDYDNTRLDEQSFYFEGINDTLFYIKIKLAHLSDTNFLQMSGPGNFYNYFITDRATADADHFKFVIKRDDNGLLQIKPLSGNPLAKRITGYDNQVSYGNTADEYVPIRMVAANITWEVVNRGTVFNKPIIPPAQLDFAYNSVLKNCSDATLTETVGKSETQTKSYTVGTEESIELFSSHEASVDVTAGVETEASMFGQSVTASVEVSVGYTYTTSTTNTSTNTWSETVEESVEVSREREIEIPPNTAVEVFDAIQSINNVKMPFVKRLRVKGKYDGNDPLTGEEITSQLLANQFGGVVSDVQDDYVEISIRGVATINKFFEVESQVNNLEGECK